LIQALTSSQATSRFLSVKITTKSDDFDVYHIPMFHTYILECADGTLYIGSTTDLERRLKEHNELKSGAHYTKIRRPVVLKYSEAFDKLGEARSREAELKNLRRDQKIALINNIGTEV
jgi:putative endonuclease